ncbi:uncharacterized protein MONOS_8264 [Monocercomonoides exilis]|uniref:uncharacterized protein n=1 Tax=Monocercomonoides exilis TaxID=2049356 RepID=UPI0035599B95|nr:hypothetical protein MONOS_8264 [Monocercomonoides exilis]|eukprot:MONOS_8264.1-p1 / transcript=MONOS_8264.1 / gene=MONOS_8264 / organism=Monocercomonoides_exilis_PA203 / gene_product=unspecified product / transcript_product=unspecified product / location=Mono_scaffold00307:42045-42617(-) / protein_length=191 / sequence_SO=supercontig / SO=protein_coding / is_pseudo=false
MRSLQFISCSAVSNGGGMELNPAQSTAPSNNHYFYFFFFHDCSCNASTPYGHDVYFQDNNNLFSSYNPFYESYTTNSNDKRVCYYYNGYQHTEKKDWLKEGMKDRKIGMDGNYKRDLHGKRVASGQLVMFHVRIDHNATRSSSPSVFRVSLWKQQKTHNRRVQFSCYLHSFVLFARAARQLHKTRQTHSL